MDSSVVKINERKTSLLPGTTVLPLLRDYIVDFPQHSEDFRNVYSLFCNKICVGITTGHNKDLLRKLKYVKITKIYGRESIVFQRPFKVFGRDDVVDLTKLLTRIAQVLEGKNLLKKSSGSTQTIISAFENPIRTLGSCPVELARICGMPQLKSATIVYLCRERQFSLLVRKRKSKSPTHPSKYQLAHSMFHEGNAEIFPITREKISEINYKSFGLQPEHLKKLKSAGWVNTKCIEGKNVRWNSIQLYELEMDRSDHFPGRGCIETFEWMHISRVLDMCRSESICIDDVPLILRFCILKGIISPETDENFSRICQKINF